MSLIGRMGRAWAAPGRSWAEEAQTAEEPRLLAYAFGASAFLTFGAVAAEMLRPMQAPAEQTAWIAARLLTGLSFGVLGFYGAAALAGLICRALGGSGGWRDTRLAFFWSCFATGPAAVAALALSAAADGGPWGGLAAGLAWSALLAPMLAAAHGFRAARVAAAFFALAAASIALTLAS